MNPNARPAADKPLAEFFPARFLKAADLLRWKRTEITVTISRAQEEEVEPQPMRKEWKLVFYFLDKTGSEFTRGYLISSKADRDTLADTGAQHVGDLAGKRITIKLDSWKKRDVLRLALPVAEAQPALPPKPRLREMVSRADQEQYSADVLAYNAALLAAGLPLPA